MRTTRPKKLTSKQPIQIVRENEVDLTDEDPQLALQTIETGVEKGEESVSVALFKFSLLSLDDIT